ncbi:hypothetical protein MMC12_008152 [Toensbergia leucococca]|nr:hypothetical protein [Toensbergia leucococca]
MRRFKPPPSLNHCSSRPQAPSSTLRPILNPILNPILHLIRNPIQWIRTCSSDLPSSTPSSSASASASNQPNSPHNLYTTHPTSPGSPLFSPNGTHILQKLTTFLRAQYSRYGIREVLTPQLYKQSLWETSGHWANYAEDMFAVTGRSGATGDSNASSTPPKNPKPKEIGQDESFGLKPMNCPGHCLLFASEKRSYKDLPIRYAEFSPLHRNENSGSLSGLTRVRRFHQDDAHIFCRPSQVRAEISKTLEFTSMVYKTFGLGAVKLRLGTRPKEGYIGELGEWERAEAQLVEALEESGREWVVGEGEGAFYGPKIDVLLQDVQGREHQTATIQLDFQLPQRFGLEYVTPAPEQEQQGIATTDKALLRDKAGTATPVIIHRAILGSLERFMALLIERYKGHWPFWLSPLQMIVLTVSDSPAVLAHAKDVVRKLAASGASESGTPARMDAPTFVVHADYSDRSVGKKLQQARSRRYCLVGVVGGREAEEGVVSVDLSGLRVWGADGGVGTPVDLAMLGKVGGEIKGQSGGNIKMKVEECTELMKGLCDGYL